STTGPTWHWPSLQPLPTSTPTSACGTFSRTASPPRSGSPIIIRLNPNQSSIVTGPFSLPTPGAILTAYNLAGESNADEREPEPRAGAGGEGRAGGDLDLQARLRESGPPLRLDREPLGRLGERAAGRRLPAGEGPGVRSPGRGVPGVRAQRLDARAGAPRDR